MELLRNHDLRWIRADNRGFKRKKRRKRQFLRRRVNPIAELNVDLHDHARAIQACGRQTTEGGLQVNVTIKNTGAMDSDEAPQVYLGAPATIPEGVQFPVRALAGFDRVRLKAGESKTVTLGVAPRQLQYRSTKDQQWIAASGKRTVSVGGSPVISV